MVEQHQEPQEVEPVRALPLEFRSTQFLFIIGVLFKSKVQDVRKQAICKSLANKLTSEQLHKGLCLAKLDQSAWQNNNQSSGDFLRISFRGSVTTANVVQRSLWASGQFKDIHIFDRRPKQGTLFQDFDEGKLDQVDRYIVLDEQDIQQFPSVPQDLTYFDI